MYIVSNYNDLQKAYTILRKRCPTNKIKIEPRGDKISIIVSSDEWNSDPIIKNTVDIKVVYGDTDSIFVMFKYALTDYKLNRLDTFKLGKLCGDKLTKEIFKRPPIELEFEKVLQPLVLLTKKRYIAKKYENTKDPFQLKCIDAKGVALTRRNYCKLVKECYQKVIDSTMDATVQDAVTIYKQYIHNIASRKIDTSTGLLTLSSLLKGSYKTKPVHVLLAERKKARNEEVQIGDRIPYIYIENTTNNTSLKRSELGEDPDYVIEHSLNYNRICYLDQLSKPLLGFFANVLHYNRDLLHDVINYTNNYIVMCGGRKLKESDFICEVSDNDVDDGDDD